MALARSLFSKTARDDFDVYSSFMSLPTGGTVLAEYVWIGGSGKDLRSKGKALDKAPASVEELPIWNFDGSSTGQAPGHDSEVLLRPDRIFRDPFRRGDNVLVMCDCLTPDMKPIPSNSRAPADAIMERHKGAHTWFGIEQEFVLFESDRRTPIDWPAGGYPRPQGPFYCGVGVDAALGRRVAESHLRACMYAGVKISGINGEVLPSQWEFQVGPCEGIESGDHLWMARYILYRVCEEFNVWPCFDAKPFPDGDWNGSGAHTNVSTLEMREAGGYDAIIRAIEKLGLKHKEHLEVYGEGNELRLTGHHETASMERFSYGVADRGASIRIPRDSERLHCGYFEDRRPASNMDPYKVTSKILDTMLG